MDLVDGIAVEQRMTGGFQCRVDHRTRACHEYDSNYGENYRFEVVSDPSLPTITFGDDWSVQEKGTRVAGGELVVVYAPGRMERIAWGPNEYFSFFASAYHCYGYGCCEQDYQHTLNVRFRADTPFESYDIDSTAVALQIPTDATMVELYFHADVTTTTWYCGGAPGPKFTHPPDRFYDSDYGANFRFALQ